MMRVRVVRLWLALATLAVASAAGAQAPNPEPETGSQAQGFNAYESFRGSVDSVGTVLKLDSSAGYDFNQHVGVFAGVPLYFSHDSEIIAGEGSRQRTGMGDIYFGGDLYLPSRAADFTTTLTIGAPTGSVANGFGTGHTTADWSNRLRKKLGPLAPFAVAGVSNSVPDTETLTRTFSSLGNLFHFEEGADFDVSRRVYVGASAYQIVPFGSQQVFDRLADDRNLAATGSDSIRENGFDAWIGFEPTRTMRTEIGYSRSATFAVNRISFNLSLNVGRLLRLRRHQ